MTAKLVHGNGPLTCSKFAAQCAAPGMRKRRYHSLSWALESLKERLRYMIWQTDSRY